MIKNTLSIFLVSSVLLFSVCVFSAELNRNEKRLLRDALNSSKFALLIAIDDYSSAEFPALSTPVADARALRDTLVADYGYSPENVVELYNTDATRNNILDYLYSMAKKKYDPGDSVLVYYAGHGFKDDITGEGFWIPVEADPGSMSTFITVSDVHSRVKAVGATHILLVSDSCFSGAFTERQRAIDTSRFDDDGYLQKVITAASRQIITSGGEEPVADTSGLPACRDHSVFACYLLKLLKENSDGYLTTTDLYRELAKMVGRNSDQKPEMAWFNKAGDEGGEFVFVMSDGMRPATREEALEELSEEELTAAIVSAFEDQAWVEMGDLAPADPNCAPRASKNCRGDSVWWFDSCGNASEVETICGEGATCRNAACVCGADYVMKDGRCEKISEKMTQTGYGLPPDNCKPGMEAKAAEIAGLAEALINIAMLVENTRVTSETEVDDNGIVASDYVHTSTELTIGPMTISQQLIQQDFVVTDTLISWKNVPIVSERGVHEMTDISVHNMKVQLYTGYELDYPKLEAIMKNSGLRITNRQNWGEAENTTVDVTVEVDLAYYQ